MTISQNGKTYIIPFLVLIGTSFTYGQKKTLTHEVYDSWKSLSATRITSNVKYTAAIVNSQEGDSYLLLQNLEKNQKIVLDRAYKYAFSPDEDHLVALIRQPYTILKAAQENRIPTNQIPKDTLAIVSLKDFNVTKTGNALNFIMGTAGGMHLLYASLEPGRTETGAKVTIRNLKTHAEHAIRNVTSYTLNKTGNAAAFITKPADAEFENQTIILYYDLEKGKEHVVFKTKEHVIYPHLSDTGDKFCFVKESDSRNDKNADLSVYIFNKGDETASLLMDNTSTGLPTEWILHKSPSPRFSANEKRLIIYTAPKQQERPFANGNWGTPSVDVWHWKDPTLQMQQLIERQKTISRSYIGYIDLSTKQYTQLATPEIQEVQITCNDDGRFAVGKDNAPYLRESQWDLGGQYAQDLWVFDLERDTKEKCLRSMQGLYSLSPDGKYVFWFDLREKHYHAYDLEKRKDNNLTRTLSQSFWDTGTEMPDVPYAYSPFTGWIKGQDAVLVYDKNDIWKLELNGQKPPVCITQFQGKKSDLTLRFPQPEGTFNLNEDQLLSVFDIKSKQGGMARLSKKGALSILLKDNFCYENILKAADKNIYVYSKSNFSTSPDLYVTRNDWKTETRISDINPQMKSYNWGTAELISWQTYDKEPITAEGIVYKPENFDPAKKYPVIVLIYEKVSRNLFEYMPPQPSYGTINIPYFVSNGYVVFTPDVHYTIGYPGQSVYNSVVSGVKRLSENSWIEKENIALHGHSWGGYETAFLITKSGTLFKAASAGAAVGNMISAYGGIRKESGMSRQFQYEQMQSRIGSTLWEAPERYIVNSPVFGLDKVETPLLLIHNDADGIVPDDQGIELFLNLRRLNKPVWLLQYNMESHFVMLRKNSKDLSLRLEQYFNHFLKGERPPVWLKRGIPAIDKTYILGYEPEEN